MSPPIWLTPPRIPVWLPWKQEVWKQEVTYFVTFCVAKRQPVLADAPAFAVFRRAVDKLTGWTLAAGLLMPDHVHLLASPHGRDAEVGNLVGALKRWVRQDLRAGWQWQPGSFDRLLRSEGSAAEKWRYIRDNPVRAGLVRRWRDWPYRLECDERG